MFNISDIQSDELVSVIIPVYNVKPYLDEALGSVLGQTYERLEIILIDDGSTDGSGLICDEYAKVDNRICVIHQENKGLSCARNAGLNIMTGEYVVFMDSDDAYNPKYVGTLLEVMHRENVEIVVCKHTIHRTTDKMIQTGEEEIQPSIKPGRYDRFSSLQALVDGEISHVVWDKMYKSWLWKNVRFPDGHVYEDIGTTYKVVNQCENIYVLEQLLYLYRVRPGSISRSRSLSKTCDNYLAWSELESFVKASTPNIFNEEQLLKVQHTKLIAMIGCYVYHLFDNTISIENETYIENLRNWIIEMGDKIGIDGSNLQIRIAYTMICFCPGFLRAIAPFYDRTIFFLRKLMRE